MGGACDPRMSDIRAVVKKSHPISEVATTAPSQALTSYLGGFGGKIDFSKLDNWIIISTFSRASSANFHLIIERSNKVS